MESSSEGGIIVSIMVVVIVFALIMMLVAKYGSKKDDVYEGGSPRFVSLHREARVLLDKHRDPELFKKKLDLMNAYVGTHGEERICNGLYAEWVAW